MSHSVCLCLQQPANEFQAGNSVGFRVRGGVKFFDHQTKTENWTNYEAVVFVSADKQDQIQFYRNALVEDAIVEISGSTQAIREFTTEQGKLKLTIEINNAQFGLIRQGMPRNNSQQVANQMPQGGQYHPQGGGYAPHPEQPHYQNNQQGFQHNQQGYGAPQQPSQAPAQNRQQYRQNRQGPRGHFSQQ